MGNFMLTSIKQNTEVMLGRAVVIFAGLITGSLLLLVGLAFLGYCLFIFSQSWLTPAYSALLTGGIFMVLILAVGVAVKLVISSNVSGYDDKGLPSEKPVKSVARVNPATTLSLAVIAGYLYQSQPQLKTEVDKLLLDIAKSLAAESSRR